MPKPEIIFIHGILGANLINPRLFVRDKIWLDPKEFAFSDLADKLSLKADGNTDTHNGFNLKAQGHLEFIYGLAALDWKLRGFNVHEFSFDWRKSIHLAADQLHQFIEDDFAKHKKKFVIVAHSMGGLVASLYSVKQPAWRDRIEQAIFMGTPLHGSYAPIEAILGTYPLIKRLKQVNDLGNPIGANDFRKMAATLVGLIEMLPDPVVFPDAIDAYSKNAWPKNAAPLQIWLDQSKNLKTSFATSPLVLEKTTLIISLDYSTNALITKKANGTISLGTDFVVGDGTVPGRSAFIPGITAYKASAEHSLLPLNRSVIDAVVEIVEGNQPNLAKATSADLKANPTFAAQPISNLSLNNVTINDLAKWLFTFF